MAWIYGLIMFKGSNKDLIKKKRKSGDRMLALLVPHSIFAPKRNLTQNNNIKKSLYTRVFLLVLYSCRRLTLHWIRLLSNESLKRSSDRGHSVHPETYSHLTSVISASLVLGLRAVQEIALFIAMTVLPSRKRKMPGAGSVYRRFFGEREAISARPWYWKLRRGKTHKRKNNVVDSLGRLRQKRSFATLSPAGTLPSRNFQQVTSVRDKADAVPWFARNTKRPESAVRPVFKRACLQTAAVALQLKSIQIVGQRHFAGTLSH